MSAPTDILSVASEATNTELILTRVCGIALGAIAAVIYICFAWYTNDQSSSTISSGRRLKSLLALLGPTGIIYVAGHYFPSTQTFGLWTITALFSCVFIALVLMLVCGAICGYSMAPNRKDALRISIQYSAKCAFEGWKVFNDAIEKAELDLHIQSKQTLAIFAYELHDTIAYLKVGGGNKDQKAFVRYFKSVAAQALYAFFQHSKDQHPDYCACYFKWDAATKQLTVLASVSGSDSYSVNEGKVLREGSLAYRAVIDAKPYVWPLHSKELKMRKLSPPTVRNIKRFIVIPVYKPAMPRDVSTCLGVLSVDSSKDGYHFADKYHVDVLKLLAAAVGEIDQILL